MGTNNFYYKNVLRIIEIDDDDYEFLDNIIDNIRYEFKSSKDYLFTEYGEDEDRLRSYLSKVIGTIYKYYDHTPESEIGLNVIAVLRYGYYDHVNLDYIVRVEYNGKTYEEFSEMFDEVLFDNKEIYGEDYENNIINDKNSLINYLDKMVDYVDSVFCNHSKRAMKIAQASNGEAMYQLI